MKHLGKLNFRNLTLTTFLGATSLSSYTNAVEDMPIDDMVKTGLACCSMGVDLIKKIKPDTELPLEKIKMVLDNGELIAGTVEHFVGTISDLKGKPAATVISELIKDSKDISLDKLTNLLPSNLGDIATISDSRLTKRSNDNQKVRELVQLDPSKLKQSNLSKEAIKKVNKNLARENARVIGKIAKNYAEQPKLAEPINKE